MVWCGSTCADTCSPLRVKWMVRVIEYPRPDRVRCEGTCNAVPSPLVGEGQGGGQPQAHAFVATPLPTPPPQGGREQAALAAPLCPAARSEQSNSQRGRSYQSH